MIKAILFDMDGVLIDAKEWHYEAFNKAINLFGLHISRYDHLRTFDGLPTKEKLRILSSVNFLPEDLHSFVNKLKQQYTMEYIHTSCKPLFHHQFALSKLKQEGYKIAVCSNSIRKTVETMMNYADLAKYLDLIVSNEDVTKNKPDPEMYLTAISKFGLKPEECLVVEDNPNGVRAGIASGAFVLQVDTVYDVNYRNIKSKILFCERNEK